MITSAIKKAARISHSALDDELIRLEEYARAEIERSGVPYEKASSDAEPLVNSAVIAYVLSQISDEKNAARFAESYELQQDQLRKHNWGINQ